MDKQQHTPLEVEALTQPSESTPYSTRSGISVPNFPCYLSLAHFLPKRLQPDTLPTLAATHTKFRAMPKHARSFATTLIPWPTLPVPDPPDLAAFARGPIPSTTMRPRSLWTHTQRLALRGGLRDTERRFTPPKPCAHWRPGLAI
ncbi:hypothetical protein EDB89DRAFT_1907991 [Lactarius sanguifluus]|nr:hypothetical protein EDB89DRAFT_1907991 [Lactarius sanguifluus]